MADPAFLLDSNICIHLLEGRSDLARQRIEMCRPGEVVTSAIAFAEVLRGLDPSDVLAATKAEAFFGLIVALPFDRAAAERYRTMSFKRGTFDRLIAAHALSLGLVFVTSNERDFADLPGLRVENWTRRR